jgi:hypothetical protein
MTLAEGGAALASSEVPSTILGLLGLSIPSVSMTADPLKDVIRLAPHQLQPFRSVDAFFRRVSPKLRDDNDAPSSVRPNFRLHAKNLKIETIGPR